MILKVDPNPNIGADFWINTDRYHVLYGGRSSSKSWEAAFWAIAIARHTRTHFLCVRQIQNRIEESVYTLLKDQIERMGLTKEFKIINNKITHKKSRSTFVFYGLWRHIDELKSTENKNICWIEEAHALTASQWEILEPTIRTEGSKFWIIFNPRVSNDFVYRRFIINTPKNTSLRKINYDENPYLSRTIREVIEAKKDEEYEEYEHIYLGVPRDDDDSVIIKRSWLNAAIDSHIKLGFEPTGPKRIGFDIADDGGDRCVNILSHGQLCVEMEWWKANEDELMKSCKRTYANATRWDSSITYDATGIGAMAGSKFKEINRESNQRVKFDKFQAGGSVIHPERKYSENTKNKDMFSNLKAQAWWLVADRLRNTWDAVTNGTTYEPSEMISISSTIKDLERLITELSTPKKDYDKTNKVKVESKKDLQSREVNSPDLADAFIMAFAPSSRKKGILDVLMDSHAT